MSARYLSLAMILSMAAPSLAETDEGSRSVGARHHSRSVSTGESRQSPPTAVRRGSSDGSAAGAQSRHPRAGSGHGPRRGHYGYYGRRYYPHAYWGYGGYPYFDFYGPWGYGYYGPRYYGGSYHRDYGSVRVLVDPSETRVFVDGHYAGTADEFDGLFQRLHVPPGRHEIALKLEGFRTHRMRVYVPYDGTLKLHHDMVQGSGEDAFEDLAGDRYLDDERYEQSRDDEERQVAERMVERERLERGPEAGEPAWLRLDVRPEGASVYVDGQFRGTGRSVRRLELPAGTHRVEILHPGLRSFERDVDLEEGESEELEVELTR